MNLTKTYSAHQYERALESWGWLRIGEKVPICASLFGDVFLQSHSDIWFLDSIRGSLNRVWESLDALRAELRALVAEELAQLIKR